MSPSFCKIMSVMRLVLADQSSIFHSGTSAEMTSGSSEDAIRTATTEPLAGLGCRPLGRESSSAIRRPPWLLRSSWWGSVPPPVDGELERDWECGGMTEGRTCTRPACRTVPPEKRTQSATARGSDKAGR